MSAPALVALAHGSRDPRSAAMVRAIVDDVRRRRPEVPVRAAFLAYCRPNLSAVVDGLVAHGHDTIVVVPLLLTSAHHARVDVPMALETARRHHLDLELQLAEVVGAGPLLLAALDERLSRALRTFRAARPDALVLAAAGSTDASANAAIARLADDWGRVHGLPANAAFASAASPTVDQAVRAWHRQGRRSVAVGSFFIAPGRLPDRVGRLALQADSAAVTDVLGGNPHVTSAVVARYSAVANEPAVLV